MSENKYNIKTYKNIDHYSRNDIRYAEVILWVIQDICLENKASDNYGNSYCYSTKV